MGKSVYLVAFVATLAIFAVVFFTVYSFEEARSNYVNEQLRQFILENELLNIYLSGTDFNSAIYCKYLQETIKSNSNSLYLIERRIQAYKDNLFSSDYILLKRNYVITNLILLEKVSAGVNFCGLDIFPIIYFYAEDKSCEIECGALSNQLEQIKSVCPKVWVFSFPYNWPDYSITYFIEKKYNVAKPATIVLNNKVFEYPQRKEDLLKEIGCS